MARNSTTFVARGARALVLMVGATFVAAWGSGCLADDPDGRPTGARMEVGTGVSNYVAIPIPEDEHASLPEVQIVSGSQGGQHIWGGLRTYELNPENMHVVYTLVLEETGEELSVNTYDLSLAPGTKEGAHEWAGLIGLVNAPAAVSGKVVEMRMTATDADGNSVSDSRRVRALY